MGAHKSYIESCIIDSAFKLSNCFRKSPLVFFICFKFRCKNLRSVTLSSMFCGFVPEWHIFLGREFPNGMNTLLQKVKYLRVASFSLHPVSEQKMPCLQLIYEVGSSLHANRRSQSTSIVIICQNSVTQRESQTQWDPCLLPGNEKAEEESRLETLLQRSGFFYRKQGRRPYFLHLG